MESLEIIIDGSLMLGGASTNTLLGKDQAFLPGSRLFKLDHFEPRPDGTCLARYSRSDKTGSSVQDPSHSPNATPA